jgi:hypothetical protein
MDSNPKQFEFPFPGERILAQWVADEVQRQFRRRASTEGIAQGVCDVLDNAEARYGKRPVSS